MTGRGIDHLVLCVDDLEAAEGFYRRLGFTTTPRAAHPFGTGNVLAQLQGNYIELLSVVAPGKIVPAAPGGFSFGAFNQAFLETRPGFSMLALASDDARRDHAEFVAKGLDTYPPFDFARQATLPDGRRATVAFSLVFVTDARMPTAAFFVCQHHTPEHFWKPDYQRHANGAVAVNEVVMVAAEPESLADLFSRLHGRDAVTVEPGRLAVATGRAGVTVLSPARCGERFPVGMIARAPATPYFVGYRVAVADLDRAAAVLQKNAVAFRTDAGRLQVGPAAAFGAVVEFAAEDAP